LPVITKFFFAMSVRALRKNLLFYFFSIGCWANGKK